MVAFRKFAWMVVADIRPVYTTLEFWYGTDKNGTGAIKKSSVHSFTLQFFPVPNNFISAFGTRTKLKCSFRFRLAESLLPSTHASCAVSKWRMECFRKFLFNFFKKRRLPYRKTRTIAERLDKMALFAFGVFALSRLLYIALYLIILILRYFFKLKFQIF